MKVLYSLNRQMHADLEAERHVGVGAGDCTTHSGGCSLGVHNQGSHCCYLDLTTCSNVYHVLEQNT